MDPQHPSPMAPRKIRRRPLLGWSIVAGGLLTNRWVLGPLVAPDGRIEGTAPTIAIAVASVTLILCGLWVAYRDPARRRGDLLNAATLVGSLAVCVAVAEGYLRLASGAEETPPMPLLAPSPDGSASYILRANARLDAQIGGLPVQIRTNRFGMHWREVDPANPGRKTRIAFVGDSFTFGCWTDRVENSFVGLFEAALDTSRYEVLNFGVPGYGMDDVAVQLRERIADWKPDVVFVMFYNGNDIRDSYLGASKYRIEEGTARWDTTVVNALIPADLQRDAPGGPLSRLGRELAVSLFRMRLYQLVSGAANLMRAERDFMVTHNMNDYPFWSRTEYPPVAERALQRTTELLAQIREDAARMGTEVVIATVPFREQVYARRPAGPGYDIRFPQQHIERFAEEQGIPFVDLLPPLRAAASHSSGALYWRFDVHLTPDGHRVVADALTTYFQQRAGSLARTPAGGMEPG